MPPRRLSKESAPVLRGWISLQELADMLGVSRQAVHKMADEGRIRTLHRAGRTRPTWLLRETEAYEISARRRVSPGESTDEIRGAEDASQDGGERAGSSSAGSSAAVPA